MLAQHIPLLGYTSLPHPLGSSGRLDEPCLEQHHSWTATCVVPLPLLKARTQLNTVLGVSAFSPQTYDNRR